MANTKTAKKMVLVHEKRRRRNVSVRTQIKNMFKKALTGIESGVDAEASVRAAASTIDKAASKGIVHKNKAARRKSRLAKKLNAAMATAAQA